MCPRTYLTQQQLELSVCLFMCLILIVVSSPAVSALNITKHRQINNRPKRVSTQYRFPVNEVDSCPTTNVTWYEAGARLNCSYDVFNRLQYLCIPNQEKTTLLEFCYDKIMGLYEKGKCLHLTSSGFVDQEDCSMFIKGCPRTPYFSSNIFKYLKCLDINRDLRCFAEDPDCHIRTNHSLPKNCSVVSGNCNYTTLVPKPESQDSFKIIKAMMFTLLVALLSISCLTLYIWIWGNRHIRIRVRSNSICCWKRNRIPLIQVKQIRNNLILVPYSTKCTRKVIWIKNGAIIDRGSNIDKFTFNSYCLNIHNLAEEDSGMYQTVASCKSKHSTEIDIHTAHLYGIETAFTDESTSDHNDQLFTIHEELILSDITDVLILKTTTIPKSKHIIYTKGNRNEEEEKLWFHTMILFSENTSLSLVDKRELFAISMETREYLFKHSTFSKNLIDEPVTAASLWRSIVLVENTLRFASEEVEVETLCVLFQTYPSPIAVINYIFELKHVTLLMKYFRLECYQRLDTEVCIYLPNNFSSTYIQTLMEVFLNDKALKDYYPQEESTQSIDKNDAQRNTEMELSKKRVRDIEDHFHQPSSTVLDSVLYYCFIGNMAPKKFLKKNFRTLGYVRKKNEKCICLPLEFTKKFIERLDKDILIHETISDTSIHSIVSEQLRVPEEVLKWNYGARKRFVKKIGKNAVKIYRSRLMIVGCAGAGKTTLLERLLNRDLVEFPKTESTVGLDIHERIFKISEEMNKIIALRGDHISEEKQTLSITDFAGQSAYYACHQVYLSRRALYVLVIDLSKRSNDPVSSDPASPEQNCSREALFDNWTYKDYYKFWMESISTYCDTTSPVILVGTHKDVVNDHTEKDKDRFSNFLLQLPDVSQLQKHLNMKNYFELGTPRESRDEMEKLEECIIEMIKNQPTWGEILPKLWDEFDQDLCRLKDTRLITYMDFINSSNFKIPEQKEDVLDMLRFYHDCGKILFFNETGLSEIIILDVQWFVDAFKNVITDHFHMTSVSRERWITFNKTGMLEEEHLITIWAELELHEMIEFKDQVLLSMQRLGLIAVGKGKHYVPSVNKEELSREDFERIKKNNHTSILKYKFPKFLPHFYFYRLVVASMEHWETQVDGELPLLFKNAAFLKYKDNCHRIVLGVSSSQIHLQIYTCNSKPLEEDVTLNIRREVESILQQLTQTFHKPVEYFPGFTCKSTNVTEEIKDTVFFRESEAVEAYLADPSESSLLCPQHNRDDHNLSWKQMLMYWSNVISNKTTDQQETCCQRLFSCRRSRVPRNRNIRWNKEDTDDEKGESSVKLISLNQ